MHQLNTDACIDEQGLLEDEYAAITTGISED